MTNKLYMVYDKVAKTLYGGMVRASNDEVARRSFVDLLTAKDSPLGNHQGDYCLLCLGEIEEETGAINAYDLRPTVADGQDWLDANKETR